jgi:rhodanese-related sulfurtransferase
MSRGARRRAHDPAHLVMSPSRRTVIAGGTAALAAALWLLAAFSAPPDAPGRGASRWSLADAAGGPALRRAARALVTWRIRAHFPDVAGLSTADLAVWLADPDRPPPVLLDARTAAELAVSHLPGARWVPPDADVAALLADLPAQRPIVVYCAVGYRSALLARALGAAGRRDVFNLEGSIFAWASEGRPLRSAHGPTAVVHPFDATWGLLLEPRLRAALGIPTAAPPPSTSRHAGLAAPATADGARVRAGRSPPLQPQRGRFGDRQRGGVAGALSPALAASKRSTSRS